MNVGQVMTRDVSTCNIDSDLEAVARLMWDKNCGSILVMDNSGALVGVITDRDIAMGCAINHKPEWELKTREILQNRTVFTCRSDEDVRQALQTMSQQHIRRLPVVDGNGQLQGILSIDDIIILAQEGNPELSYHDTMETLKQLSTFH